MTHCEGAATVSSIKSATPSTAVLPPARPTIARCSWPGPPLRLHISTPLPTSARSRSRGLHLPSYMPYLYSRVLLMRVCPLVEFHKPLSQFLCEVQVDATHVKANGGGLPACSGCGDGHNIAACALRLCCCQYDPCVHPTLPPTARPVATTPIFFSFSFLLDLFPWMRSISSQVEMSLT